MIFILVREYLNFMPEISGARQHGELSLQTSEAEGKSPHLKVQLSRSVGMLFPENLLSILHGGQTESLCEVLAPASATWQ